MSETRELVVRYTRYMKYIAYVVKVFVVIVIIIAIAGIYKFNFTNDDIYVDLGDGRVLPWDEYESMQYYKDKVRLDEPIAGDTVSSPIKVSGHARGFWFFEATAPVFVTDASGEIIGEGFIQATEPWMTEDFVPFEGTISFDISNENNVSGSKGVLILRQQNASGLPEHDDAFEVPVIFDREF